MISNYHIRDFSNGMPKTLIIILHGYGADGANLVDLSDAFQHSFSSPIFVIPDAPFPHEYMPNMGRQWFSLMDRGESVLIKGAEIARKILLEFINEQLAKHGLEYESLVFIGFSQGAMMSLFTSLKLEKQCKAVICFSGTTVSSEDMVSTMKSKPPVCIIHGEHDDVVPCALGKFTAKVLKQSGVDVSFTEIPNLSHAIDMKCIKVAMKFCEGL